MSTEPKHKFYGDTLSEWIALVPHELEDNGVSLWSLVPAGRNGFGLEGEQLLNFIRCILHAVLARGAKPVVPADDGIHYVRVTNKYGINPDHIVEGVIADWLASGGEDPERGQYRFALPHTYEQKRDS